MKRALFYWDPKIHDKQHMLASLAGGILGLGVFLTYYFFTRIETQGGAKDKRDNVVYRWEMPWFYFVVGIALCVCTGMALGCVLSVATRSRK